MTEVTSRAFLDEILQRFQLSGWRDLDGAASATALAVASSGSQTLQGIDLATVIPPDFLERNAIADISIVQRAITEATEGLVIRDAADGFELLNIDEIEAFAVVRGIEAAQVDAFADPFRMNERVIKHCIHHLIGDPYIDRDWGGERSDICSTHVKLGGKSVLAAFLLKGISVPGPLFGSELGRRGDQITRLISQRAQLSVVQHVGQVPGETIDQLRYGVIALRAHGLVPDASASVWDGVDTARLLLAAGYIDAEGAMTEVAEQANAELKLSAAPSLRTSGLASGRCPPSGFRCDRESRGGPRPRLFAGKHLLGS